MKQFVKGCCKSTFVVMLVFALSSVASAQFGNSGRARGHGFDGLSTGAIQGGTRRPQYANLYEALKAQNVKTTMTGAQLTSDWHIISPNEYGVFNLFNGSRGGSIVRFIEFTQGKVIDFGNDKYLVAYYPQGKSGSRNLNRDNSKQKRKGYLFKDSKLSLALLPLNGKEGIYEIKKFDPQKDFLSPQMTRRQESLAQLKQVALATLLYMQDYDDKMPPMVAARSAKHLMYVPSSKTTVVDTVQNRLQPYTRSKTVFLQPGNHHPYLPNYKVSRKKISKIGNPTQTLLFFEDAPDSDGMRCVAYADGHVKAITEAEFQKERKSQGISKSGYPSVAKAKLKAKPTPKS